MQFIHIKNLDKFNPGYEDRELKWCKVYFKMVNADPEFEMVCEIDKWRFIALLMLEMQIKKPIPLDKDYLIRKGFNLKQRKIEETLHTLSQSIEIINVTEDLKVCNAPVTQSRVDKSREEESIGDTTTNSVKEKKVKFLEFVLMTQGQYDKLAEKLGKTVVDDYVKRLNNYIGSKGKKYHSHYHTILNWSEKDLKTGVIPQKPKINSIEETNDFFKKMDEWERQAKQEYAKS